MRVTNRPPRLRATNRPPGKRAANRPPGKRAANGPPRRRAAGRPLVMRVAKRRPGTRAERRRPRKRATRGRAGPGSGTWYSPMLTLIRNTDAIEARYSIKSSSRYDRITAGQLPGWDYRLGLSNGEGADDRTDERTLQLDSGLKVTSDVRIKGSYKKTTGGRWYKNALSDSVTLTTETESMSESRKGTLSWNGIEKLGPLSNVCSTVRARSGVEYKRSHSGPAGAPNDPLARRSVSTR